MINVAFPPYQDCQVEEFTIFYKLEKHLKHEAGESITLHVPQNPWIKIIFLLKKTRKSSKKANSCVFYYIPYSPKMQAIKGN